MTPRGARGRVVTMDTQESRPPSAPEPGAGTSGPAGGDRPRGADEFFDRIRALGVVRPDEGRWAAGVCTGLARRWGLDPLLVRGLFVVAGVVSGIGLGLYGLLWLFLPHPDGRIHAQQVLRGTVTAGFVGSLTFVLIDLPLSGGLFGWGSGAWSPQPVGGALTVALIGFGVWWLMNHGPARPGGPWSSGPGGRGWGGPAGGAPTGGPPAAAYGYAVPASGTTVPGVPSPVVTTAPPRRVDTSRPLHSLTLTTVGVAALAAAAIWITHRLTGAVPATWEVASATALGVVALGIVLAAALGRRAGGLAPIAVVLAAAAVSGAAWGDDLDHVGRDATWRPAAAPASGYRLDAGRAVLDLTDPALARTATATSPVTLTTSLGFGELVVIVPPGTDTEINASVGLGNVTDDVDHGVNRGGPGIEESVRHGDSPVLVVDAHVGLGRVRIVPEGTEVDR